MKNLESTYDAFLTRYKNYTNIFIFRSLENYEKLGDVFDILEDGEYENSSVFWENDKNSWVKLHEKI